MRFSAVAAASLLVLAALPAQAQTAARPYKALGTEPFWSLTIDGRSIRYAPADGRVVTVARPRPIVGFNGERYVTRGLTVDVTHVECSDGMNGRTYHDTVRVTLGRRTLRGCGGDLLAPGAGQASLVEGSWRAELLDGRPVLAGSHPSVRFEGDRISGSTGCNRFNGSFTFARGRLQAGPLVTTRMACIGPGNAQERRIVALLGQRLTVSRNRAGKLVLSAASGRTITLAPERQR